MEKRVSSSGRTRLCACGRFDAWLHIVNLYVHIPFCPKICPYCSFYKEASDRNKTAAFLDAVLSELEAFTERTSHVPKPRTIFFGGGTPTALSTPQLEYLLSGLHKRLDLSALEEWTIEMNPATVSLEKAKKLLDLGVNRVSMGVQSWDSNLLKTLGRVHTSAQAERSYQILREAGYSNINLDFIFSIPGQPTDLWLSTMEKTIALRPEHISAYCLTYEEDTEFLARLNKGEFRQEIEVDAEMFELTMTRLSEAGYGQYEISNYAQPGRECLHNLGYWQGDDYLGLGPSAVSTVNGVRWKNIPDTSLYVTKIEASGEAVTFQENLTPQMLEGERLAFGLRTSRGVSSGLLNGRSEVVRDLTAEGLIEKSADRFRLTQKGLMVADEIGALFV
jgi:oxygen-independent coproporphyrinogen-3 oxidase